MEAAIPATNTLTYQGATVPAKAKAAEGTSFGEILSDLNPLQYLPVVGTIYRAITGDTIPKPLREAGGILVGGLMGGPIGAATSLATLAFEKLTGIDFEDLEQSVLSSLHDGTVAAKPKATAVAAPPDPPDASTHTGAWSTAQLAAYGIVTGADGTLRQGSLSGADVLNALQLSGET